jgi:hypothetical protein
MRHAGSKCRRSKHKACVVNLVCSALHVVCYVFASCCCCCCCCRVGGLLSPFTAISLVALGAPAAAEGVFAAACFAACAAVLLIGSKHDSGQPMDEE